jgi:hypothetical protein
MGILNVIKLANDYNKAKKLLESKKADVEKIAKIIDSVQDYIGLLKNFVLELEEKIYQAKEVMGKLADRLQEKKGDK